MALLFMDGFDHYGSTAAALDGAYLSFVGDAVITTDRQRTGTHSLKIKYSRYGTTNTVRRAIPGVAKTKLGIGMAIYFTIIPPTIGGMNICRFLTANGSLVGGLTFDSTGRLVFDGVSSSEAVLVAKAWQHLEFFVDVAEGTFEARVNGVVAMSLSGLSLSGGIAQIEIGQRTAGSPGGEDYTIYIDDLYCWDTTGDHNNDFLGDKKVFYVKADQDKSPQDWLPTGAATGAAAIGTDAPNDNTYITADAGNLPAVSKFSLSTLDPRIAGIAAVQTYTRMKKDDAGTANVRVSLESNSELADGEDRPITTKYTYWQDVFEKDPDTGASWTPQGLQNANLVLTRTA